VASPTAGIINALCGVQLDLVGCGIIPNETTVLCQGATSDTGVPIVRPGKTVTSALVLSCDTTGSGVPNLAIPLTNVIPVNGNLVTGLVTPLTGLPGTGFPLTCCGGFGTLTLTTTFSAGNNYILNDLQTGGLHLTTT
jgi:hypothetical protein